MAEAWQEKLGQDPKVQAWFKELKSKYKDIKEESAIDYIKLGGDYDYKKAFELGIRPQLDPQSGELHWGGPSDLKSDKHPTKWKSQLLEEASKGNFPDKITPEQQAVFDAYGVTPNTEEKKMAKDTLKNIGYGISKGMAAFGQGLTGADYLGSIDKMEEARQKLDEKLKKKEGESKIAGIMAKSNDPNIVSLAEAIADGSIDLDQMGKAWAILKPDTDTGPAQTIKALQEAGIIGGGRNPVIIDKPEDLEGGVRSFAESKFNEGELIPTKLTGGGVTFEDIGTELAVDKAKADIQKDKEVDTGLTKTAKESEGIYRNVTGGVSQASEVFADAVERGGDLLKAFGVEEIPTEGLGARSFSVLLNLMGSTGYNKFIKTYEGTISTELAGEFAKGAGASRLGVYILDAFKKSIGDVKTDSIDEFIANNSESLTKAYRKYIADQVDSNGNYVYKTDEIPEMVSKFRVKAEEIVSRPFRENGILGTEKAKIQKDEIDMVSPDGRPVAVKLKDYNAALKSGFRRK